MTGIFQWFDPCKYASSISRTHPHTFMHPLYLQFWLLNLNFGSWWWQYQNTKMQDRVRTHIEKWLSSQIVHQHGAMLHLNRKVNNSFVRRLTCIELRSVHRAHHGTQFPPSWTQTERKASDYLPGFIANNWRKTQKPLWGGFTVGQRAETFSVSIRANQLLIGHHSSCSVIDLFIRDRMKIWSDTKKKKHWCIQTRAVFIQTPAVNIILQTVRGLNMWRSLRITLFTCGEVHRSPKSQNKDIW